jgi:hypothetical protein
MTLPLLSRLVESRRLPISQILISDGGIMSEQALAATDSIKAFYGTQGYVLYDDVTLRSFIKQHFSNEVVAAYDSLQPYAYKADLGRYCLLYVKGGWYFDIGVRVNSKVRPSPLTEMVYFRDIQKNSKTSWACSTGMIFSQLGNPVFKTAINLVVENVKNRYYGVTPLCPSGPVVFGLALAMHGAKKNRLIGDLLPLRTDGKAVNSFVMPNGRVVAVGKDAAGGSFSGFVSKGSNNYNVLWRRGRIYR